MKFIIAIFALFFFSSVARAQDCTACTSLIGVIEGFVEQGMNSSQIQAYIQAVCDLIPGFQSTCDALAEQGIDEVVAWINQNEDPEQICQQLGLCSSKKPAVATKPTKVASTAECSACENVIATVENWLDSTSNQQEVITAIEVVCTYMPEWSTTCDAIIAWGVPTTVAWIEEYENPTAVCGQLALCNASVAKPKMLTGLDGCSICQEIVYMVENYISLGSTTTEIETYVDIACTVIPQWTQQCENYISSEVPSIIQWIENDETPQTVCTQLGTCSSKKNINVA
jgi:saposin